jgi:hypothetical protein
VESYTVNRKLSFEENGQNGQDGQKKDKGTRDVPLDLADDFLPLHLQVSPPLHCVLSFPTLFLLPVPRYWF